MKLFDGQQQQQLREKELSSTLHHADTGHITYEHRVWNSICILFACQLFNCNNFFFLKILAKTKLNRLRNFEQ